MTRSTPKKSTAKKTTQPKAPEPMDPDAIEVPQETQEQAAEAQQEATEAQTPSGYRRACYAAQTLVKEFHSLFPETPVEYSGADGRGTALDVTFDLTVLDSEDADRAKSLLRLTEVDQRVDYPIVGEDSVLVSFHSNARTQDSREPFGLSGAGSVLGDES